MGRGQGCLREGCPREVMLELRPASEELTGEKALRCGQLGKRAGLQPRGTWRSSG